MVSLNAIYAVVLGGALLHAVWNALVKGSTDTLLSAIGITSAAALIAACTLPWLAPPARASWPFLGVSLVLQITYMNLVAHIYRVADMSVGYPVMRGTAPLIVTAVAVLVFRDALSPVAIAGIVLLCAGIFCMAARPGRSGNVRGVRWALLNALIIAAYTLVDGTGARRSGAPVSYTLWIFLLQGVGMLLVGWRVRTHQLVPYLRAHWRPSFIGGLGSIASYGTALWAMTLAPIPVIAALRETAILFGILISAVALHERLGRARIVGAIALVLGAIVLRLG